MDTNAPQASPASETPGMQQAAPAKAPQYQSTPPLLQMVDYILSSPSIPSQMRVQFYALWEMPILGNFDMMDRSRLMLRFKEWCILFMMHIPDNQWGNLIVYKDMAGAELNTATGEMTGGNELSMDLNLLLNLLEQAYYINLTRGKEGFTLKELATIRNAFRNEAPQENIQKKGWRMF